MPSPSFSNISRRAVVVVGSAGLVFAAACSDDSTAPSPATPAVRASIPADANLGTFSGISPVVDGVMSPNEYKGAATISFRVQLPPNIQGGATPATVYITHDKTYLYLATVFDRQSPFHPSDNVFFEFDKDNDGVREDGDETLGIGAYPLGTPLPLAGMDLYRKTVNNVSFNEFDTVGGGTNNALSAFGAIGTKGVFEIRQELNSTDDSHDFSIDFTNGAKTIGIMTQVMLEADPVGSGQNIYTFKPTFFTYCKLTIGKKITSVACP
jgi:hypothetical protein